MTNPAAQRSRMMLSPAVAAAVICLVLAIAGAPSLAATTAGPGAQPLGPGSGRGVEDGWLEPLLQRLDSDDFTVREAAARELQADRRLTLATLRQRVTDRDRPLTPEQSLRVDEAAARLLRTTPRAAMGVSFSRSLANGVEIGSAVAGFDAQRVLRPGDIIREMSGVAITSNEDARAVILSHEPGDEVTLSVLRGGEVTPLTLRLGSFNDLQGAYAMTEGTLREAWRIRCERSGRVPGEPALDPGISLEQWRGAEERERVRALRTIQPGPARPPQAEDAVGPEVAGGGSLRSLDQQPTLDFSGNESVLKNEQAAELQREIDSLAQQVRKYERRLKDPLADPAQKRALQQTIAQLRTRISAVRGERAALLKSLSP